MAIMLAPRFTNDALIEIGIDEAGRGSFWGPIMAGAVIIPETEWTDDQKTLFHTLRDSKKISPTKREKMAKQIKELIPFSTVGMVTAAEFNGQIGKLFVGRFYPFLFQTIQHVAFSLMVYWRSMAGMVSKM